MKFNYIDNNYSITLTKMLPTNMNNLLNKNQRSILESMSITCRYNKVMSLKAYTLASVLEVKHYTDSLLCFTTKRLKAIKFKLGEYQTLGLIIRGKLIFRDYYICNPTWTNKLEFLFNGSTEWFVYIVPKNDYY